MRGVCFCEKAHFSILYTPLPSFTSCQGLSLLQMGAWSPNCAQIAAFLKKNSERSEFLRFYCYICHVSCKSFSCSIKISEVSGMENSERPCVAPALKRVG